MLAISSPHAQAQQFDINAIYEAFREHVARGDYSAAQLEGKRLEATFEALEHLPHEQRAIEYVVLNPAQAANIPEPTPDVLARYFNDRKTPFYRPEYRKLILLVASPSALAKQIEATVSDDVARRVYERQVAKFTGPERRHLQQIIFPNATDARAAAAKLASGMPFHLLAAERGLKQTDIDLGTVSKSELIDRAIADAAFALGEGAVSEPITGRFGVVLVRVNKIEPKLRAFAAVVDEIKRDIALERVRAEFAGIQDKIEDELAAGRTLTETAVKLKLKLTTIEAVDRSGRSPGGTPVPLPPGVDVLSRAFSMDVGAVSNRLQIREGGYAWYEVAAIIPSRPAQTLEEVKDQVAARWREDEVPRRLQATAVDMVEKLKTGISLTELAISGKLKRETATGLEQGSPAGSIPRNLIDAAFRTPKGAPGSVEGDRPGLRIVFRVTDVMIDSELAEAKRIAPVVRPAYEAELAKLKQLMAALAAAPATNGTSRIEIVPRIGHSLPIYSVAFSRDGRTIASGSADFTLKLWDAASGRPLRTLTGHEGMINAVAFSPDGRTVVSGSTDGLKLWDAASGRVQRTLTGPVDAVAFSPDGRTIASASSKSLKLWDAATGGQLRTIAGSSPFAFSPDGRTIVSRSDGKTLKLWDAASGRELRTLGGHDDSVFSGVAFSPDGRTILSNGDDGKLKLWDAASGRQLRTIAGSSPFAFSPDGRTIVSGSDGKILKLWDAASGRELRTITVEGQVTAVAFSPDGRTILSATQDRNFTRNTLKQWDAATGRELRTLTGYNAWNIAVAFSADGRSIVSGDGKTIKLWDAASGSELRTLGRHDEGVNVIAFSPDGRTIVSGGNDNKLKLWDAATGRELRTFTGHTKWVTAIAFSPDGRTIASRGFDKTLRIWDAANGRELHILAVGDDGGAAAFSPDGRRIVSGSMGFLRFWDATNGRELRILTGGGDGNAVAFSPDGRMIVAGNQNVLKFWDAASGRELHAWIKHAIIPGGERVHGIAFSPDGRTIVSGSTGNTLNLWDAATGRELRTLTRHGGGIDSVAFSPDGRTIISGSWDKTVRRWSAAGDLLATTITEPDGEWLTITPEGFFVASEKGADLLSVVRGLDAWSMDQFFQSLYRPDLVREKLAGDPRGLVREAAARVSLDKVLASGSAPTVTLRAPKDGARAGGERLTAEIEIADRGGGIGRIEWRVNGVTVGIDDRSQGGAVPRPPAGSQTRVAAQPLRLTRDLPLDESENEIEVIAYNRANLVASPPTRARITGGAGVSRSLPRLFLLTIGVNDYADQKFKLVYAVPDSKALATALVQAGEGLYEEVIVTAVHDADVSVNKLDATFNALATRVRPGDVFVFFIAGHGKTLDGRYYFIPQSFKPAGAAVTTREVQAQGIAQEQWQAWFSKIPARRSVLLFDTCESGTLTGEARETEALERAAASDRLVRAIGRSVLTASSGDKDAIEGYRGHGLFTYSVIEALGRADGDRNGTIELTELATYVFAHVTALSEQIFKERQEPQIRITSNYALTKPAPASTDASPGVVIPSKPTHQLSTATDLFVVPNIAARRIRKLETSMPVTLVKSEAGWALIAKEGRPLGYVATHDLALLP